ncbi:tetratricopeptide repeat protein [Thalassotalea euphylliae]|uniref:tetratricopeptide repeat protein n=1 Tax=Thalassotalea euphylliae TaxID=1655234 RepID=UPI003628881A
MHPLLKTLLVVSLVFSFQTVAQTQLRVEACESQRCKDYFTHFKKNAKRGNADSIATLAEFYYHGFGTPKNLKQAHLHYRKAARLGVVRAQYKLGLMYLNVEQYKDLEQGIKYLKRAAYNDHINAPYILGAIYYSERFGDHDKLEADKWLAKAYERGHKDMPDFIAHILSFEEITKNQFPYLYSAISKYPLTTTSDNRLVWPEDDGTEVITVSPPNIDDLLKEQMIASRKQTKHLGSRLGGKDCQSAVACKALTQDQMKDHMDITSGPITTNEGGR